MFGGGLLLAGLDSVIVSHLRAQDIGHVSQSAGDKELVLAKRNVEHVVDFCSQTRSWEGFWNKVLILIQHGRSLLHLHCILHQRGAGGRGTCAICCIVIKGAAKGESPFPCRCCCGKAFWGAVAAGT